MSKVLGTIGAIAAVLIVGVFGINNVLHVAANVADVAVGEAPPADPYDMSGATADDYRQMLVDAFREQPADFQTASCFVWATDRAGALDRVTVSDYSPMYGIDRAVLRAGAASAMDTVCSTLT